MTGTPIRNDKVSEDSNDKLLEILIDRGFSASFLMSSSSKITNPEQTSRFKLIKGPTSNRVNDLLIHRTIPVTLYNNLLTFRDEDKKFELQGDLLKMITKKDYNVVVAELMDKKMFDFAKEMYFVEKVPGHKSTRGNLF